MDHFQDFYQGTGPEVTYCKRFKGTGLRRRLTVRGSCASAASSARS